MTVFEKEDMRYSLASRPDKPATWLQSPAFEPRRPCAHGGYRTCASTCSLSSSQSRVSDSMMSDVGAHMIWLGPGVGDATILPLETTRLAAGFEGPRAFDLAEVPSSWWEFGGGRSRSGSASGTR